MKLLSILLIALLFIQAFVEAKSVSDATHSLSQEDAGGNLEGLVMKHPPQKINCNYACSRRCMKTSRKKVCHRACKSCCARCNCVPPGTYGNKNLCPCYATLKTHGNKPKCP
ncbi:hypothetical protein DH2020_033840 [Rehmannia glutinosa]|uniref:Uncharacterized protein n=1 Tax=Rehmannia glutinosa TaxID=99300 RepID=A0ABR0VE39_REHGL